MPLGRGHRKTDSAPPTSSPIGRPEPERLCEVVTPSPRRLTKESKVRAVTIAVIAVAALVAIGREAGRQLPNSDAGWKGPGAGALVSAAGQGEPKPQDVIYRMLDAAGQGDAAAYLGCYSGPLRRRLEQSRDEMTPAGFAQYLAQTNKQIRGIAISEPAALSESEVEVRIEFVYQDRNEAQQFFLEKSSQEWKIARVSAAERVEALVPFGTPVY